MLRKPDVGENLGAKKGAVMRRWAAAGEFGALAGGLLITIAFSCRGGRIAAVYIVRNPGERHF